MPRVLIILFIVLGLGCGEERESNYRSRVELDAAGAGARSWFPQWLPNDATNLREWHDLDTNSTIGRFTSTRSFRPPSHICKPTTYSKSPGNDSWWPDEARFRRLEHLACVEPVTFSDGRVESRSVGAAIDRATGDVYFWRERG
jgi:hypothetical protein